MKVSVVLPVLAPTPFLQAMTAFAIVTLRLHADNPFELVIAEADYDTFDPKHTPFAESDGVRCQADKYVSFIPKIGGVREANYAIRMASGDYIVTTGNDVIVPPHWDTELLRCFEYKDCGLASLSAFEPGAIIGPPTDTDLIVEGMYSPFQMFRRGWEWDESYHKIYQDSDLVLRMYEKGLRAYRSCRAHVHHLLRMTSDRVDTEQHNRDVGVDERLFYQRWGKSPLAMFAMIRSGQYRYGQEFDSWVRPINLHYDPNSTEG